MREDTHVELVGCVDQPIHRTAHKRRVRVVQAVAEEQLGDALFPPEIENGLDEIGPVQAMHLGAHLA